MADALKAVGYDWIASLVSLGALAGLTTVILILMMGQSRVLFAMSRDRLLPGGCPASTRYGTPWVISLITGVVVALIATFVPLTTLADMVNIGTLFAFVLVSIGVIVLRTQPDLPRAFRTPAVPDPDPGRDRLRLPDAEPRHPDLVAVPGLDGPRVRRLLPLRLPPQPPGPQQRERPTAADQGLRPARPVQADSPGAGRPHRASVTARAGRAAGPAGWNAPPPRGRAGPGPGSGRPTGGQLDRGLLVRAAAEARQQAGTVRASAGPGTTRSRRPPGIGTVAATAAARSTIAGSTGPRDRRGGAPSRNQQVLGGAGGAEQVVGGGADQVAGGAVALGAGDPASRAAGTRALPLTRSAAAATSSATATSVTSSSRPSPSARPRQSSRAPMPARPTATSVCPSRQGRPRVSVTTTATSWPSSRRWPGLAAEASGRPAAAPAGPRRRWRRRPGRWPRPGRGGSRR